MKKETVYTKMINVEYGYLKVINLIRDETSKKHPWKAVCECNNCGNKNFITSPSALLKGRTTSCGCRRDQYKKLTGINSKQYKGCGELNGKYWGQIKHRAERRGYSINISIEYAWNLYLKQNCKCALSGLPIEFAIANKNSSQTTASLDRIDSNIGYIEGNVQWVHKHVNIMKNTYDQNYFISLCKLITNNNL